MRRSVACMFLVAVLSIAQSDDDYSDEGPGLQIMSTSVQDQLSHLQRIVSTLNNPLINERCTVDLAAYGYNDSAKQGHIRTINSSSVQIQQIYFPEQIDRYRGVTLVELDATTCTTRNKQHFDTFWLTDDTFYKEQFLETLESAATGTIIVGVSADSAEQGTAFQNIVGSFFNRYNMNILGLLAREKFAFIMQKGYPKKSVFQKKPRYGESLRMRIELRGSTVSDVTFSRV